MTTGGGSPFNKGTLDAYRKIITKDLVSRSGSFSGGIVATIISGSEYQNLEASAGVTSVAASGSSDLTGKLYFTGSGNNYVTQSGHVIIISGSPTTGVQGLASSGSGLLTGYIYFTGSDKAYISQSGQFITISGSGDASTVEGYSVSQIRTHSPASHGSSHTSGSGDAVSIYKNQITDLRTEELNIPSFTATGASTTSGITGSLTVTGTISGATYQGITTSTHASTHTAGSTDPLTGNILITNLTATNITGSTLISGSEFRGPLVNVTSVIATNITGSTTLSGANIYGPTATITNINATNLTGSTISGSINFLGPNASITNVIATNMTAVNITGSTLISGSSFKGKDATITNINATYITGSTLISGADFKGPTLTITNAYVTNLTGSGNVSGSSLLGEVQSTQVVLSGSTFHLDNWKHPQDYRFISGSYISGAIDANARVGVRQNSAGTTYTRRRINFIQGSNIAFTVGDDAVSEEVDITITAGAGAGATMKGYASIANGGIVAHGLGVVPTVVQLTASGSNPLQFSCIIDATNITVYHTGLDAAGIFWRAEV